MTPFVEQLNFCRARHIVQSWNILASCGVFLRQKVPFCGIITRGIGRWGLHIAFLLFSFATAMGFVLFGGARIHTMRSLLGTARVVYPQVIFVCRRALEEE